MGKREKRSMSYGDLEIAEYFVRRAFEARAFMFREDLEEGDTPEEAEANFKRLVWVYMDGFKPEHLTDAELATNVSQL